MNIQEGTVAVESERITNGSPWTQAASRGLPQTPALTAAALELRQVVDAVCDSISLDSLKLPDEFHPAHLPVVLIDAVFRSKWQFGEPVAPAAERYCRRFGLAQVRADPWELPPVDEQETLGGLIRHYDEMRLDRMTDEVFQAGGRLPGQRIASSEHVLRAARALRRIGIDVLQDVSVRPPETIEDVMLSLDGLDECAGRMFLMHASNDDFVRGDAYVRRFVAHAIDRVSVSGVRAEDLVRQAAYELILSPRFLDNRIWRLERSRRPSLACATRRTSTELSP